MLIVCNLLIMLIVCNYFLMVNAKYFFPTRYFQQKIPRHKNMYNVRAEGMGTLIRGQGSS